MRGKIDFLLGKLIQQIRKTAVIALRLLEPDFLTRTATHLAALRTQNLFLNLEAAATFWASKNH